MAVLAKVEKAVVVDVAAAVGPYSGSFRLTYLAYHSRSLLHRPHVHCRHPPWIWQRSEDPQEMATVG